MNNKGLLESFKKDVLDNGPASTLPTNLSDKWLSVLLTQAENFFGENDEETYGVLLAAVLHILFARNGLGKCSEKVEDLVEYIKKYLIELAAEELHRKTHCKRIPATIESIFTNPVMEFYKV